MRWQLPSHLPRYKLPPLQNVMQRIVIWIQLTVRLWPIEYCTGRTALSEEIYNMSTCETADLPSTCGANQ